jgi:hypothetical protein
MLHSAESRLRDMQHSAESTHIRDFLCEIETEFKNILGCLSGPSGPSIYEKNGGRKSRETVSEVDIQ